MKANEAFSSWVIADIGGTLAGRAGSALIGTEPAWAAARRQSGGRSRRSTARRRAAPTAWAADWPAGDRGPAGGSRAPGRSSASVRTGGSASGSHLPSFLLVIGLVFLDVLVEGAAGVGHEDVVHRGVPAVALGHQGLQRFRRALGDDPALVEDDDLVAQSLG